MTLVDCPDWPLMQDGWSGKHLMSNCYHEVDHEVAEYMKTHQVRTKYAGWNFNGDCWYQDGQFHCAVYVRHIHRMTVSADTPEEIMRNVCEVFGYD